MTENLPPLYDHDSEMRLLGAIWYSGGRLLDGDLQLSADDFHLPAHERLWNALCALHTSGAPWDILALLQELGEDAERVPVASLTTAATVPQSAGWYANVLTQHTARRAAVGAATRIHQAAHGGMEADELAEFARAEIDKAAQPRAAAPVDTWDTHIDRALTRWTNPVVDAIATGWHDLDELLSGGGLRPGHLTVVGARPGVGKSLVATMLAGRTAAAGHGVYFASVEMSSDELTDRIAAAATGVNLADLTNRTLSAEQVDKLGAGMDRLRKWPLTLDDRVSTIAQLRRGARNQTRTPAGLGMIIVDYLQLLSDPTAKTDKRHELVAAMSRSLKLLAKEHHVPVVLLSQLNRGSTQRENKRPLISDLRESGAVEQDADEIILLHRDDDDPDLAGHIELHLAKNRHGQTGYVHLRWEPYVSRITNPRRIASVA